MNQLLRWSMFTSECLDKLGVKSLLGHFKATLISGSVLGGALIYCTYFFATFFLERRLNKEDLSFRLQVPPTRHRFSGNQPIRFVF